MCEKFVNFEDCLKVSLLSLGSMLDSYNITANKIIVIELIMQS